MSIENERDALAHLREARACMLAARDDGKRGSRELSVALTEADTAILWLQHDIQIKAPPVNEGNDLGARHRAADEVGKIP